jgi:hypothetical protein
MCDTKSQPSAPNTIAKSTIITPSSRQKIRERNTETCRSCESVFGAEFERIFTGWGKTWFSTRNGNQPSLPSLSDRRKVRNRTAVILRAVPVLKKERRIW